MDDYCADKSLLRLTTDRIPNSNSLQKDLGIPLAIVIKPYGELPSGEPIPETSFNNNPIVRCAECRAYINPFVKFIENGNKWVCNFCREANQVEGHYYSALDETGFRQDINERPELNSGSVDLIASREYMTRPPMPPTYMFVFDVSQEAIEMGYLQQAAAGIKGVIDEQTLPGGDRVRVCFMAYDKNLYYFNLRSTLKSPQMIVVTDTSDEDFLPIPDDMLVSLADSYEIISNLLDNLPYYFNDSPSPSRENGMVHALKSVYNIG